MINRNYVTITYDVEINIENEKVQLTCLTIFDGNNERLPHVYIG